MNVADKYRVLNTEKIPAVYEAGKKAAYDDFWDDVQKNGIREDYHMVFCGKSWNNNTFKPKYPIGKITNAQLFFYENNVTDGYDYIKNLDCSASTNIAQMFQGSLVNHVGVIDATGAGGAYATFANTPQLHTIDKFVVDEDVTYSYTFHAAVALENIRISGTIGQDISISWCNKISLPSAISFLLALADLSQSGTTKTITMSFATDQKYYFDEAWKHNKAQAREKGWTIVFA